MIRFPRLSTLGALLSLITLGGCHRGGSNAPSPAGTDSPLAVTAETPKKTSIRWTIEQPGTIQPFEVTALVAKLPGYVEKLHVDAGDRVTGPSVDKDGKPVPGTLLVELSIPEIEQEHKQKEAQKLQARQEVALAKQNEAVAAASYAVAQQFVEETRAGEKRADANYQRWMSETARVDDLVRRMVIDKQTADETRNQFLSAESARDEAIAKRKSSEAMVLESKAKLDRAAVEIQTALSRLAFAEADSDRVAALVRYTDIRAPYDGVVIRRHVHTSDFLQASGSPVLTIAMIDPVRIMVDVPESAADRIAKGTKATVRIQALRGAEFTGVVAREPWALDATHRSLRVEIDLPNPEGRIRPGNYAYAAIPVEVPDVFVIPHTALTYQDEVAYCWMVEEGKAARCQVQIGQRDGNNVEVIRFRKGAAPWRPFQGTELVITAQKGPLTDGRKVDVEK
jgi:RND family efflux transporter MFP subunit